MKNPFPGMNPWLELHWRETHARLIVYSCDQLQQKLPPGLRARVEEDVAIGMEAEGSHLRPDVHISEPWEAAGGGTAAVTAPEAATGVLVKVEPEVARHLTIVDAAGEVITALEFLSPTNKEPGDGLRRYRSKQRTYLQGGVNLVEIDLLRAGSFVLALNASDIPKKKGAVYRACVSRGRQPDWRELFQIPLRERLPALPIPLRPGDREVALELQPLIDLCCERGAYGASDCATELDPPLPPEVAAWAAESLRAAGLQPKRER